VGRLPLEGYAGPVDDQPDEAAAIAQAIKEYDVAPNGAAG
jgi:hypothetical protein